MYCTLVYVHMTAFNHFKSWVKSHGLLQDLLPRFESSCRATKPDTRVRKFMPGHKLDTQGKKFILYCKTCEKPMSGNRQICEDSHQGCQMVCFQTKNANLGKFWRALDWKMLIYFMPIWNILQTFGIFYNHLVHFVFIWYIFSSFGNMYQDKSGNPDPHLLGWWISDPRWCRSRRR
jgi:hypothetical protein